MGENWCYYLYCQEILWPEVVLVGAHSQGVFFWLVFGFDYFMQVQHASVSMELSVESSPCTVTSSFADLTVYISYSRCHGISKQNACRLASILRCQGINAVLDMDHHCDMAGNKPQWIQEQIAAANYVVVILDEAYPWTLSQTATQNSISSDVSEDSRLTQLESELLLACLSGGRQSFIVPVYIGPSATCESYLPGILSTKTVYQLPLDFDGTSFKFSRLLQHFLPSPLSRTVMLSTV